MVNVIATTLVGVVSGAALSGALLLPQQWARLNAIPETYAAIWALAFYFLDAGVVVALALAFLYVRYRDLPDIRAGVRRLGFGLVAGGLVSLTPTIAYAQTTGFRDDAKSVTTEILIAAGCCIVGLTVGAMSWVGRRPGLQFPAES